MKADLHVHSCYSDGTLTPGELVSLAVKNKISDIAVVDHDTFAGISELKEVFSQAPVNYIEGIEISAFDFKRNRKVHILGYAVQDPVYIEELCTPLLERRTANTLKQVKKIQSVGYEIELEEVIKKAQNATAVYKQHVMAVLIDKGYETTIYGPLYQALFKNNGVAEMDIEYIDVFKAIEAVKLGGGLAVVAHPGQLDSYDLIEELVSFGLDGIEKYHPDHNLKDQRRVQQLLDKYQLKCFGGSDFHGAYGPDFFGDCQIDNTQEFPEVLRLSSYVN
ncbi:PHP domain-containing protein [Candidatus Enterococcus murrayae]|uniref:PHP domain-containing protein n=1 Tax=Candidatus Enterococcus murrayae TaxID=2815321 RepID=A0ABS3HKM8_9ENTE|nr:PHP domain-containing protein [Enterococcus sp. MJM16]MBO0453494.1 PHP domain-containing protein [Enterococcus sp. MJM16]